MRRAVEDNPQEKSSANTSISLAIVTAIGLHVGLMGAFSLFSPSGVQAHLPASLSVIVIEKPKRPKEIKSIDPKDRTQEPRNEQRKPKAPANPLPKEQPMPVIPSEPRSKPAVPETETEIDGHNTEVSILKNEANASEPGDGVPEKIHIPSRWALKPPLATDRLEGLGFTQADIECLTSLEPDCQDLREEVFVEYLLTETELVWTPNRPDTGMPAEFRGLNDQEILEKLGMNYAGGNALVILPGIAIDGPLWDRLHGVNKPCRLVRAITGPGSDGAGGIGVRRVCD